jgi:hypothetical protein
MREEFQIRAFRHQRAAAIRNVFNLEKIVFAIPVSTTTKKS